MFAVTFAGHCPVLIFRSVTGSYFSRLVSTADFVNGKEIREPTINTLVPDVH